MKLGLKTLLPLLLLLTLMAVPLVLAEPDFEQDLSASEKAKADEVLTPIILLYRYLTYGATVIGIMVIVYAGIMLMIAGDEQAKKQRSKNMIVGVVIGLILIWSAPLIIDILAG